MNIVYAPTFENAGCTEVELKKLKEAIDVHGYRGPSKKRHNGVVPIRPTDTNLWKGLRKLTNSDSAHKELHVGLPVKVVAHVPRGYRMVGYLMDDNTLYILGICQY